MAQDAGEAQGALVLLPPDWMASQMSHRPRTVMAGDAGGQSELSEALQVERYETAVELLRSAIAEVSERLASAQGEQDRLQLIDRQNALMRRRRRLKIRDTRAVDQVLEEFLSGGD
jgi:hypothetical protein